MSPVLSIVLTGRGGQGVKLSSELLAWSASADGYNPIQYSVYGALIRGGEIACSLAASRDDPGVPLRSDYSLMCAMHNDWFDRYYPLLLPDGLLAYDVANIDQAWLTRSDVEHLPMPVGEMAIAVGDPRAGNMVVAGVVARLTGLASREALTKGMTAVVPAHRADRIIRNLAAVEAGYSWVERGTPLVLDETVLVTERSGAPQSLADYLWHWEATSPNSLFVSDDSGHRLTYGETAAGVRALSTELRSRGLVVGDRVAVLAENGASWTVVFLAAIASGMVAMPLATRVTTEELDSLLTHGDPSVIAVDDALLPLVDIRWQARLISLSGPRAAADDASLGAPTRMVGALPACLTYTSGTTSQPKGVVLSNAALARSSETYAAMFHSTPAMHTIVAVPLCHNTGFIDQLGHALVAGGSIEAHRRFRAETIAEALHAGTCSFFIGVPTMYHRILEHLSGMPPCELAPSLAFGGAPMPSQLIVRLRVQFPNALLANCYGLSEATSITHINFVSGASAATEVGVAVAGTTDKISSSGELLIRSPTTMIGYHRNPEATAAKFEHGWLRTGDLASRSDDGVVQVYGRVDDVINRGGEKVVPLEVEEALCEHPSVVEAAVVGLPDTEYGSIVVAAIVTSESIGVSDLGRFVEGSLADYKRPAHIVTVDHLPRNENGKVVKGGVRDLVVRLLGAQQGQQ